MATQYRSRTLRDKILTRLQVSVALTKNQLMLGTTGVRINDVEEVLTELASEELVESAQVPAGKTVYEVWFLSEDAPYVRQRYARRVGQSMRYLQAG